MRKEQKRHILDRLGWIPPQDGAWQIDGRELTICAVILAAALLLCACCVLHHGGEVRRTAELPVREETDRAEEGKLPLPGGDDLVWISTHGGSKYHAAASCSGMDEPEQVMAAQAEQRGFTPCKRCYG